MAIVSLRKFVNYNFATRKYNTLVWGSYDDIKLTDLINDYDTLDFNSYECGKIRYSQYNNMTNKISYYNDIYIYKYNRMSNIKDLNRFELTIDEAIDELLGMEEIPDYILNNIDMSSEESIIDYVEWYYKNIGPMYDENGEIVIADIKKT